MKNKGIIIFLIIMATVIVAVIVNDYISVRPDKSRPNPFAYDVDEFKMVDSELINYKESKNFKIGFNNPAAITVYDDKIYIAGDDRLKLIDLQGNILLELSLPGKPKSLDVSGGKIFLTIDNHIIVYDLDGNMLNKWELPEGNIHITAIAAVTNNVFVADAGNRMVYRYSQDGEFLTEIDGKAEEGVLHGFIIPSPYFDIAINDESELWIVNPGLHSLENYTYDGKLRTYWKKTSIKPEGFSGCCNPAYFTFLNDGRFVTSEKGLVRIKTYKRSGEFEGVVAAPEKFGDDNLAPDVGADSENNIYALDFNNKLIRVFSPFE